MLFLIQAKDAFGNIRTSSSGETFTVTLLGQSSSTLTTITPTDNLNGTYTVSH